MMSNIQESIFLFNDFNLFFYHCLCFYKFFFLRRLYYKWYSRKCKQRRKSFYHKLILFSFTRPKRICNRKLRMRYKTQWKMSSWSIWNLSFCLNACCTKKLSIWNKNIFRRLLSWCCRR